LNCLVWVCLAPYQ
ncbi:hypothetical protein D046_4696B, partial [Vibrio parahaemolyticus V-223/04]